MSVLHRETTLLERILTECDEDHVGLWAIVRQVREADYRDVRGATLTLLDFLLSLEIVEAGKPDENGKFHAWKLNTREVLRRIAAEWDQLGHDPDIGDIVWFTSTKSSKA